MCVSKETTTKKSMTRANWVIIGSYFSFITSEIMFPNVPQPETDTYRTDSDLVLAC